MRPQHVLLVYKKSLYQIYFLDRHRLPEATFSVSDLAMFRDSHEVHLATLATVEEVLRRQAIRYRKVYRARHVDYRPFDLVIAVGGDGTLIEAARTVRSQPVLGVNSDPGRSHGHFCATTGAQFADVLDQLQGGSLQPRRFNRLALAIDGRRLEMTAVNDLLISHQWPAAMSRYVLTVGERQEEQRGSGLWISTALGSTGAIRSAGGRTMPPGSKRRQYLPRELFTANQRSYALRGGLLGPELELIVTSRMREGLVFLDGCHCRIPLGYGQTLRVFNAPEPLRLILTGAEGVYRRSFRPVKA